MKNQIEESMTERDRFANDVYLCCADLAETYCGDNSCVTCITDKLMKKGYRKASEVAREFIDWLQETDCINYSEEKRKFLCEEFLAELKKKYESEGGE